MTQRGREREEGRLCLAHLGVSIRCDWPPLWVGDSSSSSSIISIIISISISLAFASDHTRQRTGCRGPTWPVLSADAGRLGLGFLYTLPNEHLHAGFDWVHQSVAQSELTVKP